MDRVCVIGLPGGPHVVEVGAPANPMWFNGESYERFDVRHADGSSSYVYARFRPSTEAFALAMEMLSDAECASEPTGAM